MSAVLQIRCFIECVCHRRIESMIEHFERTGLREMTDAQLERFEQEFDLQEQEERVQRGLRDAGWAFYGNGAGGVWRDDSKSSLEDLKISFPLNTTEIEQIDFEESAGRPRAGRVGEDDEEFRWH